MATPSERELWRIGDIVCVMVSCCSGAELQVRRILPAADTAGPDAERESGAIERANAEPDFRALVRELYPTKSDLYERAPDLEAEYRTGGAGLAG